MPTPAEELTINSSDEEVNNAISACISQLQGEKPDWPQDRLVAVCTSMASMATGNGQTPIEE
jgi:hypothetical protein